MAQDILRYDLMVQEALKSVVRRILQEAARDGLPGEHHFYVTFRMGAPGVRVSQRLREKHPEEMTIVLQHQFWDLNVGEHSFEVGLSFSGVPERLLIPFDAISTFFDPSVQFGLKFELQEAETSVVETPPAPAPVALRTPRGASSEPSVLPSPAPTKLPLPALAGRQAGEKKLPAAAAKAGTDKDAAAKAVTGQGEAGADDAEDKSGAEVVSLDAFRKKP